MSMHPVLKRKLIQRQRDYQSRVLHVTSLDLSQNDSAFSNSLTNDRAEENQSSVHLHLFVSVAEVIKGGRSIRKKKGHFRRIKGAPAAVWSCCIYLQRPLHFAHRFLYQDGQENQRGTEDGEGNETVARFNPVIAGLKMGLVTDSHH